MVKAREKVEVALVVTKVVVAIVGQTLGSYVDLLLKRANFSDTQLK